jgi:hypothetical protein
MGRDRLTRAWALLVLLVLVTATPAAAHGGSYDMKYVDGSNLVLLTMNTHQPVSGLALVHNVRLYDLQGAPVPFERAVVEVIGRGAVRSIGLRGNDALLEQTVPLSANNDVAISYTYPRSGGYTLRVRFLTGEQVVSRGEFALDVAQGHAPGPLAGLALPETAAAFLLGVLTYHVVSRRRSELLPGRPRGS